MRAIPNGLLDETGIIQTVSHYELAMIKDCGQVDIWCYGFQPTTDTIAERAKGYAFACQKIGDWFEVYDLKTIKAHVGGKTIGMPVATHRDMDTAIMLAMLTS